MKQFLSKVRTFLHYRFYEKIYIDKILCYIQPYLQSIYIKKLQKKEVISIVFLPMNVAMWKYQHLYELLRQNKRFKLYVFLSPACTSTKEQRCKDLEDMRHYFKEHDVPYVDYELEKDKKIVDIRSVVEPDILIYPQPYNFILEETHCFLNFCNKLIAYVPYGFVVRQKDNFDYNLRFNNLAWKLYYPNYESKELARKNAKNKGKNVVVAGYSCADDYLLPLQKDPWKKKDRTIKRVIWAPHFSISEGIGFSQISNFLNMAEFMRNLAVEFSNKVTFAFKPHPRLYTELCKHPEWGEEKTKEYFTFWETYPSTQLETGEYADLFKGSDAMIHDCGTFTLDYLYVGKPVLYDHPNIDAAKATANDLGKKAYDLHYRVNTNDDIKNFIDDIVLGGNDYMKEQRIEFCNNYLLPPNGKSVAQNIYDDIISSLGI